MSSLRLVLSVLASTVLAVAVQAKQGATDAIPGTSNGATNSNSSSASKSNSKSKSTVTTTPVVTTPAIPPAPLLKATLAFSSVAPLNGSDPVCTGDYQIDPYYPTLSLLTTHIEVTSANVPNGSLLYIIVNGTGGTLYPFTSNALYVTGQTGLCTYSVYVTPGTVITSINVCDAFGNVIASGR